MRESIISNLFFVFGYIKKTATGASYVVECLYNLITYVIVCLSSFIQYNSNKYKNNQFIVEICSNFKKGIFCFSLSSVSKLFSLIKANSENNFNSVILIIFFK